MLDHLLTGKVKRSSILSKLATDNNNRSTKLHDNHENLLVPFRVISWIVLDATLGWCEGRAFQTGGVHY
ncbi:hypothetical protein BH18ACI4_BH18ACI4_10540 [soil metagenome]